MLSRCTSGKGFHPLRQILTQATLHDMDSEGVMTWLTVISTICWAICFWWMHRISSKQNSLLQKLAEQANRIEQLSTAEHDLIQEVHPQVAEIKRGVRDVKAVMEEKV